ncbi:hypothetical protein SDC9_113705 [bioreactor metagenome]|uniref:Uncharacterized protein n=1 Tax=bioreactor metagenome TaxID=1076179 RepID=A0A645BYL0_9ZZZZ
MRDEFGLGPQHIILVGFDVEVLRQALKHLGENLAGHQNAGLAHVAALPFSCALRGRLSLVMGKNKPKRQRNQMKVITMKIGISTQHDQAM